MMNNNYGRYTKPEPAKSPRPINQCPMCNGMRYVVELRCNEFTRNLYNSDVKIEYGVPCPKCNGGQMAHYEAEVTKSRIPSAYYDKDIADFNWDIYGVDMSETQRKITRYLDRFDKAKDQGMGLYITSKTKGSGKTFLASCICNNLIMFYRMNTKFVSCSELINIEKYGIHDKEFTSAYDKDPVKLLCDCDVLVLDDLGVKKAGQSWNEDILFRILDSRMNSKKVTIITSNNSMGELDMDERIVDRIYKTTVTIRLPEVAVRQNKAITDHRNFWNNL